MIEVQISYAGGLHCDARHGPSGATLATDAPVDNHGRGESFSPTDLVAVALGTCMSTVMGIVAERHGIDLTGMTVNVRKGMSTDSPRRIARLEVEVAMPIAAGHPQRALLEATAMACPVLQSLSPGIEIPVGWTELAE